MRPNEGKREAILQAAQLLFFKHGIRGTSMEAIAREAKIAKPTLYAYFTDKGAVFAALADALCAQWRDEFALGLRGEGDVVERVGAALSAKYKAAARLIEGSPHAEEIYGAHDHAKTAMFAAFETDLGKMLETELGRAGIARPHMVTQILLAASFGIARKARSVAELGPAIRLLTERLLRPELDG